MMNHKVITIERLAKKVKEIRLNGKTIVTLNGSFDLMHAGHLHIIFEASKQADCLIVALNTDDSIKQNKGSDRPFVSLNDRIKMMSAIEWVDYVTYFDEQDPCHILSIIKPDVHVNGSEYGLDCVEARVVKKNGGHIHIVDLIPGLSTSKIIERIKATCV